MFRLLKSTFFLLIASLFVSSNLFAQGIPGVGAPLTLSMQPSSPRPGETVVFFLQSFSVDTDRSNITWTLDGKTIASGKGIKSVSVPAGKMGTIKRLTVRTSSSESGEFSETVLIRPTEVALLWQAATYVPPFYKGKKLHGFGGTYKVVAIPEITDRAGKKIDPRSLIYTWRKNDALEKEASGPGKNSYVSSQTGFVRQGDVISVDISSPSDDFTVTKSVTIVPTASEILMYEDSPLYGLLYEKELGSNKNLLDEEITVSAEPYYFSANDKASPFLRYTWTLNREPVSTFSGKSITLRKEGTQSGISLIGLTIENTAMLLQGSNKDLTIRYE